MIEFKHRVRKTVGLLFEERNRGFRLKVEANVVAKIGTTNQELVGQCVGTCISQYNQSLDGSVLWEASASALSRERGVCGKGTEVRGQGYLSMGGLARRR